MLVLEKTFWIIWGKKKEECPGGIEFSHVVERFTRYSLGKRN